MRSLTSYFKILSFTFMMVAITPAVLAIEKNQFIEAVLDSSSTYSENTETQILAGIEAGFDLNQSRQNRSLFSFIVQKARTLN